MCIPISKQVPLRNLQLTKNGRYRNLCPVYGHARFPKIPASDTINRYLVEIPTDKTHTIITMYIIRETLNL